MPVQGKYIELFVMFGLDLAQQSQCRNGKNGNEAHGHVKSVQAH